MKKSSISTEALGTGLAVLFSQITPRFLGYPIARFIGWFLSLFHTGTVHRALKLNQWIASGKTLTNWQINKNIRRIFHNQALALYDFYHLLDWPDLICKQVQFTTKFQKLVDECKSEKFPTMLVFPHLSGFNLGGLRLAQEGLHCLTLSYPNPSRGYRWQNKLRNDRGMEVVPFDIHALGMARERLQKCQMVMTGVDRPLDESKIHPRFFGYPTNLPVAYIKLALKTNARVFVAGFMTLEDHTLIIDVSDEIHMESMQDSERELEVNAEKVLYAAEEFIRKDPTQWMMFYPVWPGLWTEFKKRNK